MYSGSVSFATACEASYQEGQNQEKLKIDSL